jgi:pimeloyl-ACP methyl ester carboxylesterase
MPTCRLPNADLFYAERGQGQPLIFLHGLGGDHLYWLGQLRAFSKHYHCFALDCRDVGQSSEATEPYTIFNLAADIAAFVRQLSLPPVHVIGLSMGGMIAQELALANPELVQSLVLVSTLARSDEWFQATLQAFELIRLQVPDTAAFFEAVLPWWVSYQFFLDSGRSSWLRWLLRQNPEVQSQAGFLRQLKAARQHDALARLSGIRCPVMILVGEDDTIAPRRYSLELAEQIRQAQLITVPGVGHALPIENPGQFNALLREFLAGLNALRRRSA